MKSIVNKLRSRRGASITFALLLFLVCAVVSSVVIVAGTAAAGRMSRLAEMDQRYYAVTSAAELLQNMLSKESVKVVTETRQAISETNLDTGAVTNLSASSIKNVKTTVYRGEDEIWSFQDETPTAVPDKMPMSITENAAIQLIQISADSVKESYEQYLSISAVSEGKNLDGLNVTIHEKLESNGKLVMAISNGGYTLTETFASGGDAPTSMTSLDEKTVGNMKTSTKVITETRTYKWKLVNVRKNIATEKTEEESGTP